MGGNSSCNSMFGHVTIDGRKLTFGQMGSTKMFCGADGVMRQERRYFDAMKQVAAWRIEGGRLYLTDRARKDVLVYEAE
jgi:heat shock protein HslJ